MQRPRLHWCISHAPLYHHLATCGPIFVRMQLNFGICTNGEETVALQRVARGGSMYLMRGLADSTPMLFDARPQDGLEALDSFVNDLQGLSLFNMFSPACHLLNLVSWRTLVCWSALPLCCFLCQTVSQTLSPSLCFFYVTATSSSSGDKTHCELEDASCIHRGGAREPR